MIERPERDRDQDGRPRTARPRDPLGRPLPRTSAAAPPQIDRPPLPPDAAISEAQRLLDTGRPFEAHEVLEAVWKAPATPAAERDLWQGLAQLAVAVTHLRRGNVTGAQALLRRAAERLAAYQQTRPHGVSVTRLRRWASGTADHLPGATEPLERLAATLPPLRGD